MNTLNIEHWVDAIFSELEIPQKYNSYKVAEPKSITAALWPFYEVICPSIILHAK